MTNPPLLPSDGTLCGHGVRPSLCFFCGGFAPKKASLTPDAAPEPTREILPSERAWFDKNVAEGTPDAATLQTLLRQSADYVPHLIVIGGTCCPAGFRLGGVCDCGRAERQASLRWLADALPRILAAKARCDAMDAEPNPFHAVECRGHFHVKCEGETVDQSYYDQPAAEAECARRFIEWKTQRHSRTALLEQQLADSLAERSQLRARISELPRYRPGLDEDDNAFMVADTSGNYLDRDDVKNSTEDAHA